MKPIMVDSFEKCDNYKRARANVPGWHKVVEGGETQWRQKTCTVGGNKYEQCKRNGWIGKNGFNLHT